MKLKNSERYHNYFYCMCIKVEVVNMVIFRIRKGRETRLDEILVDFEKSLAR